MADDKKDRAAKDKAAKKDGGGAPKAEGQKAPKAEGQKAGGGKGSKEGRKAKAAEAPAGDETPETRDPNYKPRLRLHYKTAVIPALIKKFSYGNPMMVP